MGVSAEYMGIASTMELLPRLLLLAVCASALEDDSDSVKASCCDSFTLSSGGMGDFYQGERMGLFVSSGSSSSGRSVYQQSGGENFLFYLSSEAVWMVGPNVAQDFGGILNRDSGLCPESLSADWESDWTLEASCGNSGPTP